MVQTRYFYTGIHGTRVQDLLAAPHYPLRPDLTTPLPLGGAFEFSDMGWNNFGTLLEGFVVAPSTGQHHPCIRR